MDADRVLVSAVGVVPHLGVELGLGVHTFRIRHQQLQDVKFLGGQLDPLPRLGHCPLLPIQAQRSGCKDHALLRRLRILGHPPDIGPDPGQHLRYGEWLCDIVICPHTQPQGLVRLRVPGRQDDDRHHALLSDVFHHVHPADLRDHQIQQHQTDPALVEQPACIPPVGRTDHFIGLRPQIVPQHLLNLPVILYQQQLHSRTSAPLGQYLYCIPVRARNQGTTGTSGLFLSEWVQIRSRAKPDGSQGCRAPSRKRKIPAKGRDFSKRSLNYSSMAMTTPEPTVRPPSRMAKRRPFSMAMGVISSTFMSTLSPGMHISVPSGRVMMPVTSVVRK